MDFLKSNFENQNQDYSNTIGWAKRSTVWRITGRVNRQRGGTFCVGNAQVYNGSQPNIISRFDALISDRQVEGDRSLTTPNEPAIWVPTKTETKDTPRVVAKASKKSKK